LVGSEKGRIKSHVDVKQQIQPSIDLNNGTFIVKAGEYQLCFEGKIPALGFERFELIESEDVSHTAKIEVSANFDVK
jgi:hypothetical protein